MGALKVLYLGNSYTFCNELPSLVGQLAASADPPRAFQFRMVAAGGVTLEWHCQNEETRAALRDPAATGPRASGTDGDRMLREGGWDYVVLQEQSTRPVEDRAQMVRCGTELGREIGAHGAQPVLYLTWARQHRPEMLPELVAGYRELAGQTGARVAPVGLAWRRVLEADPNCALYEEDQSHPTVLGSYLAACVFYATFYDASPIGLTREVWVDGEEVCLSQERADLLQRAAWETYTSFEADSGTETRGG